MTIASCHLSPEGVVLGTDSTSTVTAPRGNNSRQFYLDHEQKLFEVGPKGSTIGVATYGLGRFGSTSHRAIVAKLGQEIASGTHKSMDSVANRLGDLALAALTEAYPEEIDWLRTNFERLSKRVSDGTPLSKDEKADVHRALGLMMLSGGYLLGGRIGDTTDCSAFEVEWFPWKSKCSIQTVPQEMAVFKGVPQMMERLVYGYDTNLASRILNSTHWTGTPEQLLDLLKESHVITPSYLPLREAIDWIHTVIHTTIRALKFSGEHSCGGAVEVAVITVDRPFRWVCHKTLDAAIVTAQETRFLKSWDA